ncbi:hypothetical protein NUW58_g3877 [Xylaria curta]|uniref:Uncharacterized protein n=1 Tax=Xylaria curta TaxID=42375 RepID=A0ACC1PAC6_9PEZI|nr:hypothetical protein NUW58_g3877 [Xylaria curta]
MRFKADLRNVSTFSKLVAALSSLEKIAWVRLDDESVRFTVIPDTGSQVWASLSIDFILDKWTIHTTLASPQVRHQGGIRFPPSDQERGHAYSLHDHHNLYEAQNQGAIVAVVNPDPDSAAELTGNDYFFQGSAAEILPQLFGGVIGTMDKDGKIREN